MAEPIPDTAHFIWFGDALPWVYELALRSCAARSGLGTIVFHHDGRLEASRLADLETIVGLETSRIEPGSLFERAYPGLAPRLHDRFRRLDKPNAWANMVRAAILSAEGGIYLDQDTLTLRSLRPLLDDGAFCGEEPVAWPEEVVRRRRIGPKAKALGLDALRAACSLVPGGWLAFRPFEGLYARAANNAVLGARPRHPFFQRLLEAMVELPEARMRRPFALGTHLLQQELKRGREGVVVHPAEVFFPLGPAISRHYFQLTRRAWVERVITPQTRVVHWYASVATKRLLPRIDAAFILEHADRMPFCALARPFVDA
ncbi:MAG: glycosyltransferase [Myxococcota bacterium]